MRVSKVNEVIGSSPEGFEAAARAVIARANRTLRGIRSIEVLEKSIKVENEEILEYRVRLSIRKDLRGNGRRERRRLETRRIRSSRPIRRTARIPIRPRRSPRCPR